MLVLYLCPACAATVVHDHGRCDECVFFSLLRPGDPPGEGYEDGACLHPMAREWHESRERGRWLVFASPAVLNADRRCPHFVRKRLALLKGAAAETVVPPHCGSTDS